MLIMIIGMSSLVAAASFDCTKATTTSEKLICKDPELSKLDEQMAKAYHQMRNNLDKNGKNEILKSQKMWLKYWPTICENNNLECAREVYRQRINEFAIENNYLQTFTKYDVHIHSAKPSEYDSEMFQFAICDWTYTALNNTSNDVIISSINHWLIPSEGSVLDCVEDNGSDTENHTILRRVSSNVLMRLNSSYFMGHGAAHPNGVATYSYFNISQNRELLTSDIFAKAEWNSTATAYIYQHLQEELQDMIQTDPGEISKMISTTTLWEITPSSLNIQFNSYDVAPYVSGPQEVTIPWTKLKPYLTPFAKKEFGL
jgi:uncharacterized protein